MNGLCSISPTELTLLAVIIGFIVIVSIEENEELDVIGNFFIGVGSIIVVAASQGAFLSSKKEKKDHKDKLQRQLDLLREELESLSGRRHTGLTVHP